tara:strand:+ start:2473 stop:3135 length:663 start_codon:yes stop_codon:yes gene_type:complete
MGAETSDPGSPGASIDPDVAEEENMMAGMTQAESDAAIAGAANDPSYDDFAGSTALANQANQTLTGNILTDALVPGLGTLSVINAVSAQQTQAQLQQGASPVYGSSGNVVGTMGTGLFGGDDAYTGAPEGDPNPPGGDDGNDNQQLMSAPPPPSGSPGQAVKGVSNTTSRRIKPKAPVRAGSLIPRLYSMSGRGRGRGINTSSQGILGSAPVQRKTLLGS